jgi:hypothetical protein
VAAGDVTPTFSQACLPYKLVVNAGLPPDFHSFSRASLQFHGSGRGALASCNSISNGVAARTTSGRALFFTRYY